MSNYETNRRSSTPAASTRWRARLFPRVALSRRAIIDRRPAVHLNDADKAYVEAYDILSAFPGQLEAIYQGLSDAALAAQAERTA